VRYIDVVKGYTAMDKRLTTIKPMHPSIKCVVEPFLLIGTFLSAGGPCTSQRLAG